MMQCIDARRDEKIAHENKLLAYKIQTLEITTVAERSQIHSQYFQDVRTIRENYLDSLGEQWYKIQRDRRGWEAGVPGKCFSVLVHTTTISMAVMRLRTCMAVWRV
jgi:Sds3-like